MTIKVETAIPRVDTLAAKLFATAGYDVLKGWPQASSAANQEAHFTPYSAAKVKKQGWIEWFLAAGRDKRTIFAELDQENFGRNGFALRVYGRERLEQMKGFAEEIKRQCDCEIKIVIAAEHPKYEELYTDCSY